MFNEEGLKQLSNDPRLLKLAPIFQRAAVDEHYKNGLLAAASKTVSPDYAEFLNLAINKMSNSPISLTQGLNTQQPSVPAGAGGGLFNV